MVGVFGRVNQPCVGLLPSWMDEMVVGRTVDAQPHKQAKGTWMSPMGRNGMGTHAGLMERKCEGW